MFFTPRFVRDLDSRQVVFTSDTKVSVPGIYAESYIRSTVARKLVKEASDAALICESLTFAIGIPEDIRKEVTASGNREEYAIVLGRESAVYATEECGLLFGLATLLQLADIGELTCKLVYDYPVCPVRGYRVYMPGRENIGIFKDMIDLLAYYKYNAIILEIGGAMEYKKHPEINEAWVKFCDDMRQYSARYEEVQSKYNYFKNSVHVENGDGSYLTQEECRDIAAYCRQRGLEDAG